MRYTYFPLFSFICLSLTSPAANPGQETVNYPKVPQVLILSLNGNHYPEVTRALSSIGFRVVEVSAADYLAARNKNFLLIVPEPEGRRLDPALLRTILSDLERGMPLLSEGVTPLAAELGLEATGNRGRMIKYRWERYAEDPLRLPDPLRYPRFKANPALPVLARDLRGRWALVVAGSRGQGRFIHSALPLESPQGMVYEYLPFLVQAIVDELRVAPTLAADNLCIYVDASNELDPVAVAAQLKSWSVREVHLAAFYDTEMFHQFTRRFIEAAHLEGIAVYAWLEYPMVSAEFWKRHPEWREVTASGQPAIIGWRQHMALEDPDCLRAVVEQTRRLMLEYDWDGVDLAELYFEAAGGIFKHPERFTPMHPTFRRMFQRRYGSDPIQVFRGQSPHYWRRSKKLRRALTEYRSELVTELTDKFLDTLARCREEKPYLQTTLTFIDSLLDPTVKERYGVDTDRLLALQEKYEFAVEVEDPYTVWSSSPDRYHAIGQHYRPRLRPGTQFSIDINITNRMPPVRPLDKPRGLELYEQVAAVAANADLVTLYGYSTFTPEDMRLVSYVIGAQQVKGEVTDGGTVQAVHQLYWRTDMRGRTAYLDGREWPCFSDSQVLIPAGAHTVATRPQLENAESNPLRIESVSGKVLGTEWTGKRVTLAYESRGRCYVTLNRRPATVLCDSVPSVGGILSGGQHVSLVLPQGKHVVVME
jgi:hypothetical protein